MDSFTPGAASPIVVLIFVADHHTYHSAHTQSLIKRLQLGVTNQIDYMQHPADQFAPDAASLISRQYL
jgi:hypothetical protein